MGPAEARGSTLRIKGMDTSRDFLAAMSKARGFQTSLYWVNIDLDLRPMKESANEIHFAGLCHGSRLAPAY